MLKKKLNQILTDFFWDWDLINMIKARSTENARQETIYCITNRISIDKTIQFLEKEKNNREKYWTLAGLINSNFRENEKEDASEPYCSCGRKKKGG